MKDGQTVNQQTEVHKEENVLTGGCQQDQGKQKQQTIVDSSHGADGPHLSQLHNEKQVVCS